MLWHRYLLWLSEFLCFSMSTMLALFCFVVLRLWALSEELSLLSSRVTFHCKLSPVGSRNLYYTGLVRDPAELLSDIAGALFPYLLIDWMSPVQTDNNHVYSPVHFFGSKFYCNLSDWKSLGLTCSSVSLLLSKWMLLSCTVLSEGGDKGEGLFSCGSLSKTILFSTR